MPKPLSVQLYSLRDYSKTREDFVNVVKRVADIGFQGVEPAGLHDIPPAEFKKLLDDLGLKIFSSHSPWARNPGGVSEIVDTLGALGLKTCVCGYGPDEFKDLDAIKATAENTNKIIEKLKAAGMPILGKTNLDEFAQGSSTEHSAYQTTHNPWDTERVPGGSGGGSASAVAAFEAPIALGTDTGGSIRQPGALTGTVGVKPTYGGVSRFGAIAMASSLDQIGPVSRTVLDSALLQEIIGGHDKRDSTSIPEGPRPMVAAAREGAKRDLKGMKVGLIKELGGDGFQPGVEARFNEAVDKLKEMGAEVVEVSVPHIGYSLGAYYIIMPSEVSSNLARYDGMRYGLRVMPPAGVPQTAANMMAYTREAGFGDEVKRRIILGTYALSAGYYDAWYGSAQKVRTLIIDDFKKAFEKVDVLVGPTSPVTAFKFGEKTEDPMAMYAIDITTIPANLAGVPAMSIPAGLSDDGLPVGFQFLAPQQRDEVMYKPAAALEAALEESWNGPIWQSLKTPWLDGLDK